MLGTDTDTNIVLPENLTQLIPIPDENADMEREDEEEEVERKEVSKASEWPRECEQFEFSWNEEEEEKEDFTRIIQVSYSVVKRGRRKLDFFLLSWNVNLSITVLHA